MFGLVFFVAVGGLLGFFIHNNKKLIKDNQKTLIATALAIGAAIFAHFQANKSWVGWDKLKEDVAKRLKESFAKDNTIK